MTITLPALIALIITAGIFSKLIASVALGLLGTLLGPWIAHRLQLPEPCVVHISGQSFVVLWSIIGAAAFVEIVHLISKR